MKRLLLVLTYTFIFITLLIFTHTHQIAAQPAKGANKFLGNITTRGQIRSDFLKYWNQITGENESKWGTVEGTRDRMNWSGTDRIAEFARQNGILWKFHTLIWGAQCPSWIRNLSKEEQLEEINEWFDEAAKRYPDVHMIDVVNEGYPSHQPPPFKEALGGDGKTGFDWIIKAFEMARKRWPNAILIYNDYNTIEWDNEVNWMVRLANAMKEAKGQMDAIGVQAHDAAKLPTSTVKRNLDKLAATGYPIVVSEYDIDEANDETQRRIMEDQFTMFWNHPKVIGVTYWGYVLGSTWRNNTGLLRTDGTERPALTWLIDFVKKNPNPPNDFPNMIKNVGKVSIYTYHPSKIRNDNLIEDQKIKRIFDLRGKVVGTFLTRGIDFSCEASNLNRGYYIVEKEKVEKGYRYTRVVNIQ